MNNEVDFPTGPLVGYIQLMVYSDINRQTAIPLSDPIWCDMNELLSDHYKMGSVHSIAIPANSEPISYTVAMIPFVGHVDHPGSTKKVLRRLVYLVRSELWPLLDPLTMESLSNDQFPGRDVQ